MPSSPGWSTSRATSSTRAGTPRPPDGDQQLGLVLTNNHVIDQTTGLTGTLVATGQKFTAKWLGYDKTDDVR